MPIYRYRVLTEDGIRKDGAILADSYDGVYRAIRAKHYQPIEIRRVYFVSQKVSLNDLMTFFLHINFQLKCGVGINDAIESFADFHGNKTLNAALLDISASLKEGKSIGEAFENGRLIFDDIVIGLLRSVESTGDTAEIISDILNFLKLQREWKNNVKRAIAYPVFITVVAIIVLILGVNFLGPQVVSLVQTCGEIPTLTQFAINVLPWISRILFLLLAVPPFLLLTRKGRDFMRFLLLRPHKIGELIIKIILWQFCKVLHVALSAKLDFSQAMDLAIKGIRFDQIKEELKRVRSDILEGYGVAASFSNVQFIPREILMAIHVGEGGNNLAESFGHISEDQYREILFRIKALGQILSIGLTLFTGLIFIFVLCSLFYPIYNYVEIAGM
ncbi:MAG: type II secretion system F family protein [Holosporaceae bacterium]|jgi:type IV pilus assembly protein PilC|nr:type II secretion system F family protein [Holosporaceae bacterium]